MIRKFLMVVCTLALVFSSSGFLHNVSAQELRTNADVPTDPVGDVDGAFIKSTYGTTQYSYDVEDYYMMPEEAREFATKFDVSSEEQITWYIVSLFPGAGNYLGAIGVLSSIQRNEVATAIRSYTNDNKPVHITISDATTKTGSSVPVYIVEAWDGESSSIEAYPAASNPDAIDIEYVEYY